MAEKSRKFKIYTPSRRLKLRRWKMPKFVRVFLMAVVLCAFLGVSYLALAKLAKPYLISHRESREIASINKQIGALEAENQALRSEVAYAKTSRGAEVEARKLGWVKPGEVAVVVGTPPKIQGKPLKTDERNLPVWKKAVRGLARLFVRGS